MKRGRDSIKERRQFMYSKRLRSNTRLKSSHKHRPIIIIMMILIRVKRLNQFDFTLSQTKRRQLIRYKSEDDKNKDSKTLFS